MLKIIKVTQLDYYDNLYITCSDDSIERGDYIVGETKRGLELLNVVKGTYEIPKDNIVEPDGKFLRLATEEDLMKYKANEDKSETAMEFCINAIKDEKLDMNLVNAKFTLDMKKLIFNFTADDRVDFRSLVRVLATRFKTRIELRQIGVRDEAKYLGGIGPCGRAHCCSTFLGDFVPVSIQMAKNQDLSLSPSKISGACGRLMCCLNYEDEYYEDARTKLPDVGAKVKTPAGIGRVIGINILDLAVRVKGSDDYIEEYGEEDIDKLEVVN